MTLLTICEGLAKNVGMKVPTQIVAASQREWIEALQFCNEVGEELARRVDWGDLTTTETITGDGTNKKHSLSSYFSRMVQGACVIVGGAPVRALTRAEWGSLTATEGTPRYFLLEDTGLTLWPYLANAETGTVIYQTKAWCSNGTDAWSADDETSLIDEDLFLKALIVRWRRQKGMPYADEEAEYEAALAQYAGFDNGGRG